MSSGITGQPAISLPAVQISEDSWETEERVSIIGGWFRGKDATAHLLQSCDCDAVRLGLRAPKLTVHVAWTQRMLPPRPEPRVCSSVGEVGNKHCTCLIGGLVPSRWKSRSLRLLNRRRRLLLLSMSCCPLSPLFSRRLPKLSISAPTLLPFAAPLTLRSSSPAEPPFPNLRS